MDISRLRIYATKLVDAIRTDDPLPVSCLSQERVDQLSEPTILDDLFHDIEAIDSPKHLQAHSAIVWVEACFRNPHGVIQGSSTNESAERIQKWTIEAITPPRFFAPISAFDPTPPPKTSSEERAKWRLQAVAGIRLLAHLNQTMPAPRCHMSLDLITSLASFTNSHDPWTRPEACEAASALLDDHLSQLVASDSHALSQLLITLLESRVKPLFSKTKTPLLTAQSRKALYPLPSPLEGSAAETELKPWKFRDVYMLTVFRWILNHLDETTTDSHWPLVIPPLLTILDDELTANKVAGCELLQVFLQMTPPTLLQRTGLGEIFQDTLLPYLSYLPTLTPEDESLRLLQAVYPALMSLIRRRFPETSMKMQRLRALDKVLRMGVVKGYAHAGEYVSIATLLIANGGRLVEEMGIYAVKHLKDLIPLLSSILSAPFATSHPPLLQATAATLSAIILNCWPRMEFWKGEVLQGVTACWIAIQGQEKPSVQLRDVQAALQQDIKLLRIALGTESDAVQDIDSLLLDDPRLREMLEARSNH